MKRSFIYAAKISLLLLLSVLTLISCAEKATLLSFIEDESEKELDFVGYEFKIKTAWANFWNPIAIEGTGEALTAKQDAIIKHNNTIMEKYNCKISTIDTVWDFATKILAEIGGGTSNYSMFDSATRFSYDAMKSGLLQPWDYSGIDLTDYEKYGNEQYLKGAVVDGLHYGIWAYKWEPELEYRGMVIVNNNLSKNYIDINVHELKESGKWTFDEFKRILEACTVNIGTDPIYPLSCYDGQLLAMCSVLANGGNLIDYDEASGKYEFGLLSPQAREGLEYANDLYKSDLIQIDNSEMSVFIDNQKAAFALCESWNLTYALKKIDNMDVITFPYGPSAEYGVTPTTYRTNGMRYLSVPITEDIDRLGQFVNVWMEELEDMPKASILEEFNTITFFNDPSLNENTFMSNTAIYDYGSSVNEIYDSIIGAVLSSSVTANAGISEILAANTVRIQDEIDKNLNN